MDEEEVGPNYFENNEEDREYLVRTDLTGQMDYYGSTEPSQSGHKSGSPMYFLGESSPIFLFILYVMSPYVHNEDLK